jgi:hypothetical protein
LLFSSIVNKNVNLQSFFLLLIPISNRFHYCATQKERQIVMPLYPMPMHIIEIFESGKNWGYFRKGFMYDRELTVVSSADNCSSLAAAASLADINS